MNVWTVSGNCGRDAEVRATKAGKMVTSWSVAVNSGWGDNKTTTWANCNYWGDRGEKVAPYLKKGQQVVVSGELTLREWTDKEGNARTTLDVNVKELTLIGGKPVAKAPTDPAMNVHPPTGTVLTPEPAGSGFEDDSAIPF